MRLFLLLDLESHLLEILESLVAPNRKNILIKVIKLHIAAFGNDPQHKRIIGAIVFNDIILQSDDHIQLLDTTWKEGGLAEGDVVSVDLDEIFCL